MAGFKLAERALADVELIAGHTLKTWGAEQAALYLDLLDSTFRQLGSSPAMGRKRPEFGEAVHDFPAGSHVVFYLSGDEGIIVLRVLHKRQDPRRHLDAQ